MQLDILMLQIEACPNCLWKIIGMFLAALLLGLLLGWLIWSRYRRMVAEAERERDSWHAKHTDLEKDHASLKYELEKQQAEVGSMRSAIGKCEADKAVLEAKLAQITASGNDGIVLGGGDDGDKVPAQTTGPTYASIFTNDNLQIIEGVGPKIESILKDAGLSNWALVGAASVDRLNEVLEAAGPTYRIHNPESWPRQAQLANQGKWEELVEYQKFLDGGKQTEGDFENASKIEKLFAKALGFTSFKNDNLKIVEGVGPKIEELLKNAGVNTWSDLAATSVDRLKEILAEAGDRYRLANPESWPRQAELASEAKWSELKSYQDFLSGGKDPA